MKTRLIAAAMFFITCTGTFAQTKNDLMEATNKLINISNEQDYSAIIDMVHPRVFEAIQKDDYLQALEKKMRNDDYTIYYERTDPSIDYGALTHFEDGLYCVLYYNVVWKVELTNKVDPKKEEALVKQFKKLLNTEHVYMNAPENRLDAKNRIQVLAIADNSTSGQWKFVLNPNDPREKNALPEALRNGLDPDFVQDPANVIKQEEPVETMTPDQKADAIKKAEIKRQQDDASKKAKKKA